MLKNVLKTRYPVNRLGLFTLFLMCGLLIFVAPQLLQREIGVFYQICLAVVFFLSAMWLRSNRRLHKYFQVFFAFFVASLVVSLHHALLVLGWSDATIEGLVFGTLLRALFVVIPVVLLTKISGNDMASIYLKKGRLRLGLVIGLATFLFFLSSVFAPQVAAEMFGGQNLTFERVIPWLPWILALVLSNGVREELWHRGLFLKKYEPFLGAKTSNLLQAIIFSLWHLEVQYTPFLLVFLVIVFFGALALGFVMQKTDSLLGSALLHAGSDIPIIMGIFSNL